MSNSSPVNSNTTPQLPRLYVVDTVALILRLENRTMGATAQQTFLTVEAGQDQLFYYNASLLSNDTIITASPHVQTLW